MKIRVPKDQLAEFCRKNHIRKLALFGSVLRDDFRPDSDVDVLVEFEPGHVPGFRFISLQAELSRIFGGRTVDLVTPKFLNRRIRDEVLSSAEVQYAEGWLLRPSPQPAVTRSACRTASACGGSR